MSRNLTAVVDRLEEVPARSGWHSPTPWIVARLIIWALAGATAGLIVLVMMTYDYRPGSSATSEINAATSSTTLLLGVYILARAAVGVIDAAENLVTRRGP
jgi:hypothetical protein